MNTQSLDRYMIDVSDERYGHQNVEILFTEAEPITNRFYMRTSDRSKVDRLIDDAVAAGWMERTPTGARLFGAFERPEVEPIEIALGIQWAAYVGTDHAHRYLEAREEYRGAAERQLTQMLSQMVG